MDNEKVKVFLAYHDNFPRIESKSYMPIFVGRENFKGETNIVGDNTGDNISKLNTYYCELTGYYWAWKNYLPKHPEIEYAGFSHYRRIPDLARITDECDPKDYPVDIILIDKIFQWINSQDLYSSVSKYDIILPYERFFTAQGIGGCSEDNPPCNKVIDIWRADSKFHEDELGLMGEVLSIINEKSPLIYPYAIEALNKTSAYLFNMYIMKRDLLDEFFGWMFMILDELNVRHNMWDGFPYKRLLGYLTERMINFWLGWKKSVSDIKIGYFKQYFLDVYEDSTNNASYFNYAGLKELELRELLAIAETSSNLKVLSRILALRDELYRSEED